MPLFHPSPPADVHMQSHIPCLTNHLGTISTPCFLLLFPFSHVHQCFHIASYVPLIKTIQSCGKLSKCMY